MLVTLSSSHLPDHSVTSLIAGTSSSLSSPTVETHFNLGPSLSVTQRTRKISARSSLQSGSIFSLPSSIRTVTALTSPHPSLASTSSFANNTFPRIRTVSSSGSLMNVFTSPAGDNRAGSSKRSRSHSGLNTAPAISSRSPVEDGGEPDAEAVNETIEILQRHASSSQGSTSPNLSPREQQRKQSVRMVGRGGQGSRPRRAKTPPINPRDQIPSPTNPSVNNAVHRPTTTTATSDGKLAGVRVVGRGGFGSKLRSSVAKPEFPPPQQSDSINSVHPPIHRPSTVAVGPDGTIRVSGRGGAGSRPRATVVASSTSGTKPRMQFIRMKWKGRKKSMPNIVTPRSDSPVSSSSPMRFAPTHTRAATLPIDPLQFPSSALSKHDESDDRPLPPIPPSPTGSTIELSSTYSTNTSLSVFLHSSDSHPSVPASPRSGRNTGSKLERTLGDPVPTALLFSTGGNRSFDTHATSANQSTSYYKRNRSKSRRRASISLSSLGSFMRLPREPSSTLHPDSSGPDQEEQIWDEAGSLYTGSIASCWVDNKFDSQSRDGATTPVSPMIFSERLESPKPPKTKLPNGSHLDRAETASFTSASLSLLASNQAEGEPADENDNDQENEDDESFLRTPPTASDIGPLTPHSLSESQSDILSPIVFSERPVSMFRPPSTDEEDLPSLRVPPSDELDITLESRRPEISTPRSKLRPLIAGAVTKTDIDPLVRSDSPFIDSIVPIHSIHARLQAQERMRPVSPTQRSEGSQGWSGEWNRRDMQEVIQGLRELR